MGQVGRRGKGAKKEVTRERVLRLRPCLGSGVNMQTGIGVGDSGVLRFRSSRRLPPRQGAGGLSIPKTHCCGNGEPQVWLCHRPWCGCGEAASPWATQGCETQLLGLRAPVALASLAVNGPHPREAVAAGRWPPG